MGPAWSWARRASSTITVSRSRLSRLAGTWRLGSASIALIASALPAPRGQQHAARGRPAAPARLSVIRSGGGLGESCTPRHRACSPASSVAAPGNSEATWPSGPMPSTIRSSSRQPGSVPWRERARASPARSGARPPRGPSSPSHAMDALGRDRGRSEQRLCGQPVVALRVIGRHAALVGEPQLDAAPVDAARRRAARRCARGVLPPLSARWATPRSARVGSSCARDLARRARRRPSRRRRRSSGGSQRRSRQHGLRPTSAPARRSGSRSSAWRMPSPRMPVSPREAPGIVHSRSSPRALRSACVQAARPAVEAQLVPGRRLAA